MSQLTANRIHYSYGGKVIFQDASLSVEHQQIVGILGSNGAGKTTLFDLICGMRQTTSGSLAHDFGRVSYLSQTLTTSPTLRMCNIFEMIMAMSSDRRVTFEDALIKLTSWDVHIAERFTEIWKMKSSLCSYGEKRWFLTLALLCLESDLLILDEPTAGVDPLFRHYIWRCIEGAAASGATVIVSSHNIEEIARHCHSFYMLTGYKFNHFHSEEDFLQHYQSTTLDEAFIIASSL